MTDREYVVWEETTTWPWWVVVLLVAVAVAGATATVGDAVRGAALGRVDLLVRGLLLTGGVLFLGVAARSLFGRLRVVVTRTSIKLTYGYTRLIEKLVTFEEIEDVEPVRYSPIREFGGWGLRYGGGRKRAWTVRGDGAVVLTLDDGIRLYIGSENPERLAGRIRTAMGSRRGPGGAEGTRRAEETRGTQEAGRP